MKMFGAAAFRRRRSMIRTNRLKAATPNAFPIAFPQAYDEEDEEIDVADSGGGFPDIERRRAELDGCATPRPTAGRRDALRQLRRRAQTRQPRIRRLDCRHLLDSHAAIFRRKVRAAARREPLFRRKQTGTTRTDVEYHGRA